MLNKNVTKPDDLSGVEWLLLQHIATLSENFYQADASTGFKGNSTLFQAASPLKFAQLFAKLKTAGYLLVIPMAFDKGTEASKPLYALTALGKKATHV